MYIFIFDFPLNQVSPDWVLELFTAIARGDRLRPKLLNEMCPNLRRFISTSDTMSESRPSLGTSAMVWETGQMGMHKEYYQVPFATHHIRFVTTMQDVQYNENGFCLPLLLFEYTLEGGLFCSVIKQEERGNAQYYYKENCDLLKISLEGPKFPSEPNQKETTGAGPEDFKAGNLTRLTPEMREELIQISFG